MMIVICLALASFIFSVLWLVQKRTGDSGIVDVAWGTCVGIFAILFCIAATGDVNRRIIIAVLASVWAGRLSWHVLQRCLRMPEDGRYVNMKEQWGAAADWRMFRFYQMQAAASVLFALPMMFAAANDSPLSLWDASAIVLWIAAIGGETLADGQLDRFRRQPANRGKVCRVGLWRYSRHPNYFFEWLHWWTYVLLAANSPYLWAAIVAPMAMLFFILKVTGIPPTEEQALRSRGDAYRDYQATTSPFFPWFPKADSAANRIASP